MRKRTQGRETALKILYQAEMTRRPIDKAIENYETALALAYDGGFFEVIESALPSVIAIYTKLNRFDKAEAWRQKFKEKYPQHDI